MGLTSIIHLLRVDNLDKIIRKVTLLVRVALIVCILLSAIILVLTPFATGEAESNIEAGFFFLGFYSITWGTIPSMILLIIIALDNRYRKKPTLQPIRIEVKLLTVNVIVILIVVTMIGLIRLMGN